MEQSSKSESSDERDQQLNDDEAPRIDAIVSAASGNFTSPRGWDGMGWEKESIEPLPCPSHSSIPHRELADSVELASRSAAAVGGMASRWPALLADQPESSFHRCIFCMNV